MNTRSLLQNQSFVALALLALASTSLGDDAPVTYDPPPAYPKAQAESASKQERPSYHPKGTIPGEVLDEAMGGKTINGTPVTPRTAECFPAEPRDLFWKMDWVVGKDGKFGPLDFDEDGSSKGKVSGLSDSERDAIRGRNTWLLWGGGNETFWNWLQQNGYGLTDYLILMDSRQRANRFKSAGLINQPGFTSSAKTILGLYLDQPKGGDWRNGMLRPPPPRDDNGEPIILPYEGSGYDEPEPERYDAQGRAMEKPVYQPKAPPGHPTQLFEPWMTLADWDNQQRRDDSFKDYIPEIVRSKLPQDGLDTSIYGYPSGIFGLRLMLNPDFFAKTANAAEARAYWKKQVESTNGRYYTDTNINADPKLVRPFRVTMSCGFCHVAQHPLNPPVDNAEPEWENLSSIIGAQYWDPQAANANLRMKPDFLYHFLKSQAPGSIDTSLVSTDHINNTNVINPIFDVPSRLARALEKPSELQSRENLMLPSIENPETSSNPDGPVKQRHFPMVLGPGEDSIGILGALERVPHNVGVFPEYWLTTGNLVLGYTPQRPFSIEVGRANSVYWNVNVNYRVPYMAKFFDIGYKGIVAKSTSGMKLKDAREVVRAADGRAALDASGKVARELPGKKWIEDEQTRSKLVTGRKVFLDNCAICHSSKLPKGFDLQFERAISTSWDKAPKPGEGKPPIYTLPMEYTHWDEFRASPAMKDFRDKIAVVAGAAPEAGKEDEFLKDNFLSNELRIPITLTGTYSGRAMATNAMRGNVWDNYSSETFKTLKSVGDIRYFNPYKVEASAVKFDPYGTNDQYNDGRKIGGPGYFRPATLISIWATAPFFHNNALGIYNQDPSVKGRLEAFDDAIRKLLWNKERTNFTREGKTYLHPGDIRSEGSEAAANDPGYIYRLPVDSRIRFQPGFIQPIIQGLLVGFVGKTFGAILFTILSFWSWVVLTLLFALLIWKGHTRHAGILLLLVAVGVAAIGVIAEKGGWLWLYVAIVALAGILLLLARGQWRFITRAVFVTATLVTLFAGILVNKFLTGHLKQVNPVLAVLPNSWLNADYKGIDLGPIPRGTPVNLLMNLDPDLKKIGKVAPALVGLTRAILKINKEHLSGEQAYEVFAKKAGPALMAASKCPDFVLDRGHWFGESLTDEEKENLIVFLKTL